MTDTNSVQNAVRCGGGLSYRVNGVDLLENIELELKRGQLHAVIGENGAGKTTLLDVLARDVEPSSGWVKYRERPISEFSVAELALRRAYLRQHHALEFGFRAIEVIRLGRLPFGPDSQIVDQVVTALALKDLCHRDYTTLSGGEKQRVQIARVLTQVWQAEDMICLLDEPLTGLDFRHQFLLMKLLRELASRGLTIVMVMHDLRIAARYADQLVLLEHGQLLERGQPSKVLTEKNLQRVFGTSSLEVFSDAEMQT